MQSVTNDNFGPLVAYLVPGATVLWGLRPYSPELQHWFAATPPEAPTLGGFLYLTVAALAVGMTVNAVRWVVLDSIHARTGLLPPDLDFSRLAGREQALALLIDIHYKHFQFHGSMFIATAMAYLSHRASTGFVGQMGGFDVGVVALEVVFFLASRDILRKYYRRTEQLLRSSSATSLPPKHGTTRARRR
jgi:hypothetical protein